jgi:hypothetical protein
MRYVNVMIQSFDRVFRAQKIAARTFEEYIALRKRFIYSK